MTIPGLQAHDGRLIPPALGSGSVWTQIEDCSPLDRPKAMVVAPLRRLAPAPIAN